MRRGASLLRPIDMPCSGDRRLTERVLVSRVFPACQNLSVTRVMMIMRPKGIWLSTDRRITKGGQPEPDAPKQLLICCPPAPGDGPRILLGFTGLAEMPDGTPTLQWIRETIRGESRPFVPLMQHLQAQLTRDVGQRSQLWKHGLVLVGGVLDSDGRRRILQIANLERRPWQNPQPTFELMWDVVPGPMFCAIGSGQPHISRADARLAVAQSKIRPANWGDHSGLLAAINRRTAARSKNRVSPWCEVTYLLANQEGAVGRLFREPGDPPSPIELSVVMDGLDGTELTLLMRKYPPGTPIPKDEEEQAARRSVEGRP
jgi:hypothetical protein